MGLASETKGTIIFLNGCSSAGKTTLARHLQSTLTEVYYRIAADDFMNMVDHEKMRSDFYTRSGEALTAMHHTIRLFSDMGASCHRGPCADGNAAGKICYDRMRPAAPDVPRTVCKGRLQSAGVGTAGTGAGGPADRSDPLAERTYAQP